MSEQYMAATIQAKDLRAKQRQPLQDVVPISTPFVVYIEPTNLCNFRCQFCPTGDKQLLERVGRPSGSMTMELFRKIVGDLGRFGRRLKLVSLYKDGEPLMHKQFPDMVAEIRQANVAERVWTKTNGALLKPDLNQRLIDSGLDMICISVEAVSSAGYRRIADAHVDYERFRENVADLFSRRGACEIYVKIADSGLSEPEIKKFHADFGPISTYVGVEKLMGWSYSGVKDFTLGTNPDTYDGLPLVPKVACPYPFYVMAINWNGSVSVCGNDWSHNTVVGNAAQQSLQDIWSGERLFEFQKMHLEGNRKRNLACGDCYYIKIVPDNIDPHRALMLEKLYGARSSRAGTL